MVIKDDLYEELDFGASCDLVGLTCMSHQASRAYQIADEFRKRGVPVVIGGFHATLAPDEAARARRRRGDRRSGRGLGEGPPKMPPPAGSQGVIWAPQLPDLKGLPTPRYDLLDLSRYRIPNLPAQTTRGCPYACSYCEVTQVYALGSDTALRRRWSKKSRCSLAPGKRKFVYFVDDIFNAHRKHAFAVMEGLLPLKVAWTCLCTANVGDDAEMLDLMAPAAAGTSTSAWNRSTRRA